MRKNLLGATVLFTLFAAAVVMIAVHQDAAAQSGSRGQRRSRTAEEFHRDMWAYLTKGRSAYKNWKHFPGQDEGVYEGQSPHGAFLRMYANRIAADNPKNLPHGSIIVKENYGKDKKTLMAVTVMYKTPGFDAKHNDWYWIKYLPNGKVAKTPKDKGAKPIAGRFASCIKCHSSAAGGDYVFAND